MTLIAGTDIGFDQAIGGLELVEGTTVLGGTTLQSGNILVSLVADDASVGDNGIATTRHDIFILDVTQTTLVAGTAAADATLFFEGADVGLDTNAEALDGLALMVNEPPVLDLDADDSSRHSGADFSANFAQGGGPVAITDADASLTDVNVPNVLSSLTVTITNLQDGVDEVLAADTSGTSISAEVQP